MTARSDTPVRLEVHGARGSAAVSGAQFIRHGGNTTCYSVELPDGHRIILDCGSGLGRFQARRDARGASGPFEATILLTHFHWDHIQGLPLFGPLYDPATRLHIIGAPPAGFTIAQALDAVLRPPWFPVRFRDAPATVTFEDVRTDPMAAGSLELRGVPLPHPGGSVGYRLETAAGAIVFATDVEGGKAEHETALRTLAEGAALLIHDAQYTPEEYREQYEGWGHSTWEHATRAALAAGVERLVLTSHDPSRTDEQVDDVVAAARAVFPPTEAAHEGLSIVL